MKFGKQIKTNFNGFEFEILSISLYGHMLVVASIYSQKRFQRISVNTFSYPYAHIIKKKFVPIFNDLTKLMVETDANSIDFHNKKIFS